MNQGIKAHTLKRLFMVFVALVLSSCATLDRFVDPPRVTVTNIEVLPMQGMEPRFAVTLNILNSNPVSIPITGLAYDINLNGYEVFSGVTTDVPTIPAYKEVPLRVELGTNLLQSIGFVTSLMREQFDTLDYSIDSKISVAGITRAFSVSESGQVSFGD